MKHLNIKVYGDVIDVNFRLNAKQLALDLGISGFARNEPDGTVFIEAEGSEVALQQFVEWCKIGSKYARVEKAEVSEGEVQNYSDFKRV